MRETVDTVINTYQGVREDEKGIKYSNNYLPRCRRGSKKRVDTVIKVVCSIYSLCYTRPIPKPIHSYQKGNSLQRSIREWTYNKIGWNGSNGDNGIVGVMRAMGAMEVMGRMDATEAITAVGAIGAMEYYITILLFLLWVLSITPFIKHYTIDILS